MKPAYWEDACASLSATDPVLAGLIKTYPGMSLRSRGDAFHTLARSIVGQQISVKAADSVWTRLELALGDVASTQVLLTDVTALRACGLSARKVEYLSDLARHEQAGRLDPQAWQKWEDEAIIAELCAIRGIGRWTAEMFLMFHMLRPDVLPLDDVGLIKAMAAHYHAGERPVRKVMQQQAESWRPWRSVATWYLWRSLDPVPVEY